MTALISGFERWMDRGSRRDWRRLSDDYLKKYWRDFLAYLSQKTGRNYSDANYVRQENWK